jgi:hypothetical protein
MVWLKLVIDSVQFGAMVWVGRFGGVNLRVPPVMFPLDPMEMLVPEAGHMTISPFQTPKADPFVVHPVAGTLKVWLSMETAGWEVTLENPIVKVWADCPVIV